VKLATVHGTAIQLGDVGILIRGKPGAGKSTIALALIDQPGYGLGNTMLRTYLIADDQVEIWQISGAPYVLMKPPSAIAGKLEIRGVGIVSANYVPEARLHIVADVMSGEPPVRMPRDEDKTVEIEGYRMTRVTLWSSDPQSPAKLRAAVAHHVATPVPEA
jgi:HPr kinase/phosphorylase